MDDESRYAFISYSHEDEVFVARLINDLTNQGIEIWVDKQSLTLGTSDWEQAVRDAIRNAYVVMLVASPSSRRSKYVQDELAIAEGEGRPIYPIWADGERWIDCVPIGRGGTATPGITLTPSLTPSPMPG
jgi:hypothetical protein